MARAHYSTFVGRAGKTRLPVQTIGGPDDPANGPVARLALRCRRGDFIEKGERYLWFAPGFRSRKQIGCMRHPPRPSELDASIFSEILAAQEDAHAALDGIAWSEGDTADDIRQQVNDALSGVKDAIASVAEQYDSAAEAMGSYGAGSQMSEWAENIRQAEIVDWEADSFDDPDEPEEGEEPDLTQWTEDLVSEASDKVDGVERE